MELPPTGHSLKTQLDILRGIFQRVSNESLERTFQIDLEFVKDVISECETQIRDQSLSIQSSKEFGGQIGVNSLQKIQNHVCQRDNRFEVREVEGRGKSVFAKEDIPADALIGEYHGYVLSGFRAQKVTGVELSNRKGSCKYLVPISGRDLYFIDPTLAGSECLPEFENCVPLRINEPPPGFQPNCRWVRKKFRSPEIWSRSTIAKGEELFLYYGDCFTRDYEIAEGCKFDCWDELEEELK